MTNQTAPTYTDLVRNYEAAEQEVSELLSALAYLNGRLLEARSKSADAYAAMREADSLADLVG